jgi:heat shock protein HslJ
MKTIRRFAAVGVILGSLFFLTACGGAGGSSTPSGTAPAQSGGDITGTEWVLSGSSMNSLDFSKSGITARFEQGKISGFSGVNQYSGPCELGSDGSMKIGPLAGTLMAGPEPLMRAETAYLQLLPKCDSYKVEGSKLTLYTGGNETLIYEAGKPAELSGSTWDVTGYNNGKQAVVGVSLGATLTLDFGTDNTVSGDSGVNTFSGPYSSGATSITIGPLASTRKAGPADMMAQEAGYIAALQNATKWEVVNGRLELRDSTGALQVTAKAQ